MRRIRTQLLNQNLNNDFPNPHDRCGRLYIGSRSRFVTGSGGRLGTGSGRRLVTRSGRRLVTGSGRRLGGWSNGFSGSCASQTNGVSSVESGRRLLSSSNVVTGLAGASTFVDASVRAGGEETAREIAVVHESDVRNNAASRDSETSVVHETVDARGEGNVKVLEFARSSQS